MNYYIAVYTNRVCGVFSGAVGDSASGVAREVEDLGSAVFLLQQLSNKIK